MFFLMHLVAALSIGKLVALVTKSNFYNLDLESEDTWEIDKDYVSRSDATHLEFNTLIMINIIIKGQGALR